MKGRLISFILGLLLSSVMDAAAVAGAFLGGALTGAGITLLLLK